MGGVLDQHQVVAVAEIRERPHIRHQPVEVHRNDGARPARNGPLDLADVEVAGVGLDVHEHRGRPRMHDGVRGGDEGHRRGDHFVARPDVERSQAQVERAGAARHCHRMLHAEMRGELLLEQRRPRPGRQEHAAKRVGDGGDVVFSQRVAVELDPGHQNTFPW
jgi:hypothetical protein